MNVTVIGTVVKVIDGDTVKLDLNFGFGMGLKNQTVHLSGINARELHEAGGQEAKTFLSAHLPEKSTVMVVSQVDGEAGKSSYKADLLKVDFESGAPTYNVATQMVLNGYAIEWNGSGERPVPAWPLTNLNGMKTE